MTDEERLVRCMKEVDRLEKVISDAVVDLEKIHKDAFNYQGEQYPHIVINHKAFDNLVARLIAKPSTTAEADEHLGRAAR